ncbi:DUF1207 domain-containing protein [Nitrospira sp. KM1]|uniref:DUF1207 domain-containing protein n=1 Tax=Nitrospira sp. KM1 TaxID=1936990 RepID=UPI001565DC37|nr:DUF1207 domain-containing protein [Nitrospira sp. KM1]
MFLSVLAPSAAVADDSYILGYAAALLEHEFGLSATIRVTDGAVTVHTSHLSRGTREKVLAGLKRIPDVRQARVVESGDALAPFPEAGTSVLETRISRPSSEFLPRGTLFEPLHADPRWPHFSAAYRRGTAGPDPKSSFAGNFGDSLSLYRHAAAFEGQWELGLQAGVFSIFDVGSPSGSQDLFNADYLIAITTAYRTGPLSGLFRLLHLSSHLGDEYILNSTPPVTRLGLALEGFDARMSYDVSDWLRVYGGGGYFFSVSPSDIKRGTGQFGAELTAPKTYFGDTIRPVAYADFQSNQRTDWTIGRSLMMGVQFEHFEVLSRNLQLLLEYYAGPSPNGDFLFQKTEWFGIGLHFYL